MSHPARASLVPLVVAAVAFATSAPLARLARPAHPMAIACGRVLIGAIVLSCLDLRGLWRSLRAMPPDARGGLALSGLVLAAHFALFQVGLETTSLPAAVSLVSLEPVSVVLWAWWWFGERPSSRRRWGVAVATLGAVVVAQSTSAGEHRLLGDVLVLFAVALFGVYVALARKLRDAIPARHYAPAVYAVAALALLVVAPLFAGDASAPVWPLPSSSLAMIALVGLVPTVVGHTSLQIASRTLPASLVALVPPAETVGSLLLFSLWLGGAPTAMEAVGAGIILSGVILTLTAPVRPIAGSGRAG